MAFKSTFKSWINVILVLIIILSTSVVAIKNCRRIQEQEQDLEYSKDAVIRWEQCLFRVKYPKDLTVGSKAEFGCKYGFYLLGAKYAECGASEKWIVTEKRLECHRIKCRKPDFNITHGNISQSVENISPEPQGYIQDSIIWVECDSGYKPKDSAVRVCLYNDIDHDDNTVFTGIWSQRDEDGHILEGGDSKLECVQDINIIESEKSINTTWVNYINSIKDNYKYNNINTTWENFINVIEQNLLVFILSCAALVGFVVCILLIIRLKINKTKQTGDATEMERLLKTEKTQKEELQDCVSEKEELKRELGELKSEKEEASGQFRQLQKWRELKHITNGRCLVCMINTTPKYNQLKSKRDRLVNMIVDIKELIQGTHKYENIILDDKQTVTGPMLLKLIGEFKGLVDGCDISRSKNDTLENESEMQYMHELEEVRKLNVELEIPCLHCVQLEKDCEQKDRPS